MRIKRLRIAWVLGVGIFLLSFVLYAVLGRVVDGTHFIRVAVPDVILQNLGPYNLNWIIGWGEELIYAFGIAVMCTRYNRQAPFALFTLGALIIIKSFCMVPTCLAAPAGVESLQYVHGTLGQYFSNVLIFNNDLFFSGHVSKLMMLSLLFYGLGSRWWGRAYALLTIFMVWAVLASHIHYTIDVIGALGITPTIYWLCQYAWRRMRLP